MIKPSSEDGDIAKPSSLQLPAALTSCFYCSSPFASSLAHTVHARLHLREKLKELAKAQC